jgi:hypothetical protein
MEIKKLGYSLVFLLFKSATIIPSFHHSNFLSLVYLLYFYAPKIMSQDFLR